METNEPKPKTDNRRKWKPLIHRDDPLRSLKRALDQLIAESKGLPSDVVQKLRDAQELSWRHFVQAEEQTMAKARQ